jgi:hypothetical protein
MQKLVFYYKRQNELIRKYEISLNLKFKPHDTYNTNQTSPGFHSSFYIT